MADIINIKEWLPKKQDGLRLVSCWDCKALRHFRGERRDLPDKCDQCSGTTLICSEPIDVMPTKAVICDCGGKPMFYLTDKGAFCSTCLQNYNVPLPPSAPPKGAA